VETEVDHWQALGIEAPPEVKSKVIRYPASRTGQGQFPAEKNN